MNMSFKPTMLSIREIASTFRSGLPASLDNVIARMAPTGIGYAASTLFGVLYSERDKSGLNRSVWEVLRFGSYLGCNCFCRSAAFDESLWNAC